MARERVRRGRRTRDEPRVDGEDWVEWGGEVMLAAGFTEGGAPYGIGPEEFRSFNEESEPTAGWARAKRALRAVFEAWAAPEMAVSIGFVSHVGSGISREIYAAEVEVTPDSRGQSGLFAVLLPGRDADPDLDARTRKELDLLGRVRAVGFPFHIPRAIGVCKAAGGLAFVREFVRGIELDLRAGRQPGRPWEVVAGVAAAVHSLDPGTVADLAPGTSTRREHAQAALAAFDGIDAPEADDARAWAIEHLPPATPSRLVHGDLLGQNILLRPGAEPAVIDWEYAERGDPAYDLAIVSRGVRRPFQIDRGLERLLEAYRTRGGADVTIAQVRVHELCIAARWLGDSLAGRGVHPPDEQLGRLRGLLRRAAEIQ